MKSLRAFAYLAVTASLLFVSPSGKAQLLPKPQIKTASRYKINLAGSTPQKVRDVSSFLSKQGFDVAGVNYRKQIVEVIMTPIEAQAFQKRFGDRVSVFKINEVKKLDPRFLNPQSLEARMRELAAQFPNEAKLHKIGETLQGRPVMALEITSPTPNLKPNILIDGMHHAREVMTPEIALDVAETLLQAQRSARAPLWVKRTANDLMKNARIWVVPMVNPDGNNIVWTSYNMWRKNARATDGRVHGVDINRNYPFQWDKCQGSSGSQSNETYRGASPASEPETQALVRLGDLIKPIVYLSYHSYSELVLSPYGCQGQYGAERALIKHFGERLAENLPTDDGRSKYTAGTSWEVLYAVDGASIDYFYAAYGALSYVLEVNEDFQPSYDLRAPTLAKHRNAWMIMLSEAVQSTQMIRVIGPQGRPMEAKIEFAEIKPQAGERALQTNAQGVLFKVLAPGKYHLRATAAGRTVETEAEVTASQSVIDIQF